MRFRGARAKGAIALSLTRAPDFPCHGGWGSRQQTDHLPDTTSDWGRTCSALSPPLPMSSLFLPKFPGGYLCVHSLPALMGSLSSLGSLPCSLQERGQRAEPGFGLKSQHCPRTPGSQSPQGRRKTLPFHSPFLCPVLRPLGANRNTRDQKRGEGGGLSPSSCPCPWCLMLRKCTHWVHATLYAPSSCQALHFCGGPEGESYRCRPMHLFAWAQSLPLCPLL